jgi:hypothetical protein
MSSTPGTYKKCEVKSAALLAHGNALVATLSSVRRDQIDLVTCREAADAHQVPATSARCCPRHSIARQLSGGIHSGIFPPIYMPLAVPYPRKCALSEVFKVKGSVQVTPRSCAQFCARHQVWYCARKNEAMVGYSANRDESGQQDTPKMKMRGAKT